MGMRMVSLEKGESRGAIQQRSEDRGIESPCFCCIAKDRTSNKYKRDSDVDLLLTSLIIIC